MFLLIGSMAEYTVIAYALLLLSYISKLIA